MIRRDLQEAGIDYRTQDGFADFHAAGRHTFITSLLRSGAKLVDVQKLARHASIEMTMKYTHIGLDDQATAVNLLPSIPVGEPDASNKCLRIACSPSVSDTQKMASSATDRHQSDKLMKRQKPRKNKVFVSSSQPVAPRSTNRQKVEAAGIECEGRNF